MKIFLKMAAFLIVNIVNIIQKMEYNITMKNKSIKTPFEEHSKELFTNWYKKWTNDIRSKIPTDFNISDKDIYSEITHNCIYLSNIFKGGNFPAYCNKYIVLRSVQNIWNEYKMLDHSLIADAYEEFEDGEDYTENHVIIDTDISAKQTENERHEKIEQMTKIYEAALQLDMMTEGVYNYAAIVDDMRIGMSMDKIAKDFGTYKMDISRRLATIKDKVLENMKGE